jgi:hypothetical protein
VRATRVRLEEWFLENHAHPVNLEEWAWPAARTACVLELAFAHCCEHGVPTTAEVDGCAAYVARCSERRCKVAGVSFALVELSRFEAEAKSPRLAQMRELERMAATLRDSFGALRDRLLGKVEFMRAALRSPAFRDEHTGGRPRMRLAQAITRHLDCGGFSHAQVAAFMGTEGETARKRSKAEDSRSIVPFEDCCV